MVQVAYRKAGNQIKFQFRSRQVIPYEYSPARSHARRSRPPRSFKAPSIAFLPIHADLICVHNRSRKRCAAGGIALNHSPRARIASVGYSVGFSRSLSGSSWRAASFAVAVLISRATAAATSARNRSSKIRAQDPDARFRAGWWRYRSRNVSSHRVFTSTPGSSYPCKKILFSILNLCPSPATALDSLSYFVSTAQSSGSVFSDLLDRMSRT